MYNTRKDLLDAFHAAPAVLEALLAGYAREQAVATQGASGDWSVIEVLRHLRDVEERSLERMRKMRDEQHPFIESFDPDTWARERNYAGADPRETLSAFLRLRAQHLAELEALSEEEWQRGGKHEEHGDITIMAQTAHLVAHDYQHAAQIARQLGTTNV